MPDPKPGFLGRIANFISSYFSTSKTKDASTQRNTSVSPPISRTTSPFSVDSEEASQASTKGSETASVTSKNKSKSAGEVFRENIALALAKQKALLAEESSRHQKEFDDARQQAKIIAGEKSNTPQPPLDERIKNLFLKTKKLGDLVSTLSSTTPLEPPQNEVTDPQQPQRWRGSEDLIGAAIIPPAPPKKNTTTTTSASSTASPATTRASSTTTSAISTATSATTRASSTTTSAISTATSASIRASSLTRAKEREPSANDHHGPTLAQASIDYEKRFNEMREKIKSNGGPDSAIPSTLKDNNGKYKVVGGIRYYGLNKEDEKVKEKVEDPRTTDQRSQDRAKEIQAMKKRGAEAKAEYKKFNQQQEAKEAEQEVKIQHLKLAASKKPTRNSSWPQSNQYFAHGPTNNYKIDTSPQNSAQEKPDPNSGLAKRADQRRSESGPTQWEDPAITHDRNNAQALNASYSAQTSKTSGAKNLLQEKENVPPGHEDRVNAHYSKAFTSTTKSSFAQQVLARATTGGQGVEGGRGAGG